ncbi:hypothetical protein AZ045_004385 [Enterobacter hormaechei]|nr:hypothetical protein AZ045_004385 [Enterobacter hormaechei]
MAMYMTSELVQNIDEIMTLFTVGAPQTYCSLVY